MSGKFFYLYLIGGTVALVLLIFEMISAYPDIKRQGAMFYIVPTVLLYYMAYKTYHVKNDSELM